MMDGALAGWRLLVVEDEMLVLMLIEEVLGELGCTTLSSASCVDDAVRLVESETFDAAILDRNLAGEAVYPVADALAARGVPFIFATGYGGRGLREAYRDRPLVQKPFRADDIARALTALRPLVAR